MKKLLAIVLCLSMVLSTMSFTVFADNTAEDVLTSPVEVSTYEDLLAALEEDNANIILTDDITASATENSGYGVAGIVLDAGDVLDGNNKKLTINDANSTWDCVIAVRGGEIKNLTIAGAMRGAFMPGANGDVIIDNCTFEDVVYTFNSDDGSKDYGVTIKNSTINGWTSFSDVHKFVIFENCTFGEGCGYAFCRPYNATTFVGCEFNSGYEMEPVGEIAVALNECTYAGEPLNEYNAASMFYAGGTVTIDNKEATFEEFEAVAQIGDIKYASLQAAVNSAKTNDTITVLCEINGETVKLPAAISGLTITGAEGATLKDSTIMAHDGNSINYEDLTIEGLTFDNSRISITGWRTGGATIKNLVVTNNTFKNLDDTTNSAPLHINMAATEPVNGLTFTNNVIDGVTGGSKSGIYAQATGEVIVKNNVINNVSFRPFVIQITTDDGIDDNFVVEGNTFSGSAAGRLQGLGNNDEGTDNVNLVITNNIIDGVTDAQQICYWNFNPATTTSDLSRNYYSIDILSNPSKIYYNAPATSTDSLIDMGIFPFYTALDADGKIDPTSMIDGLSLADAAIGDVVYSTAQKAVNAATAGDVIVLLDNAKETIVLGAAASTFSLRASNEITLDLNGFTAKQGIEVNSGAYKVVNGTIEGNITVNGGSLVLEDVTATGTLAKANTATVEIVSGTYAFDPTAYVVAGKKAIVDTYGWYTIVGAATVNNEIAIEFEEVETVEGEALYNINVVNADGINRLNSADLSFKFTSVPVNGGDMAYELLEVANISITENTITPDEDFDRYMFNYDLKDDVVTGTGNKITIGQVKVTGYGDFTLEIVEDTNEVHATTVTDNVVDTYVVGGGAGKGTLVLPAKLSDKVLVPVRTLTINVAFPNEISGNAAAYQDMKVAIEGNFNGVEKVVEYNLGALDANKGYVVTNNELVLHNAYNVTVSGAGYRTARYTVTMTEDKTLNFWNNVKDNDTIIEVGKDSSAAKVTFLAGDIVKDSKINIYDLSAVVSYFGTIELNKTGEKSDYAKYDLNRDGKIDSKDVAYVLVSWGK